MDVKRLNEQRKGNQGRFPVDFCFRIAKEERDCLRSQIATFTERTRDRKYLPYVFTEQGVQAMLDSGIASLFQVGVKPMNQQMKRNPDRFPEDFCFQLTKEEILRSQFATSSSWGGRRYLPYVYTEQGIIVLAGVLRYGPADKMAVEETVPALVLSRTMPRLELTRGKRPSGSPKPRWPSFLTWTAPGLPATFRTSIKMASWTNLQLVRKAHRFKKKAQGRFPPRE